MHIKTLCFSLQGLKSHAVTMFEVGKLSDESMDSFLTELEKVKILFFLLFINFMTHFSHSKYVFRNLKTQKKFLQFNPWGQSFVLETQLS